MNLKKIIYILILIYVKPSFADYEYLDVNLKDNSSVSGQVIARYDKKWFWEVNSNDQYIALFVKGDKTSKIKFFNEKEIKTSKSYFLKTSSYSAFLMQKKLFFQRAPFKGWNYISTGNEGHHLYENMYGNYAWDIQKKVKGATFYGNGQDNKDFYTWKSPIYSPVSGVVADLSNDEKDHSPDLSLSSSLKDRGDGNYILIHLFDKFYASFLHLKKASIPKHLKIGSKVTLGSLIGKVGNSGITYVPHLHLTLYYWSEELNRMISVPTFFSHINFKSGPTTPEVPICIISPRQGQSIKSLNKKSMSCSF